MSPTSNQAVSVTHIESKPDVCGGKPCIAGTRIRVWDIHVWHELHGKTPAEIATEFPQITVADVYAALAYFHDHRAEIQAQMNAEDAFSENLKAAQGSTKLSLLRDALLAGKNGDDNPVSS
jgi:uncharacterized protein (DUF433 family)